MRNIRVAYCTGFWCTNIGNGFFSLGVEHVLKNMIVLPHRTRTLRQQRGKRIMKRDTKDTTQDIKLQEVCTAFRISGKYLFYEKLEEDVRSDPLGKVKEVRAEIDWLLSVKEQACKLTDMQERGELPLRVTHNDTKINNVLFDEKTDRALVVIDLDTVMPGLVGHDYGDAIRFAANYVSEDSPEAEKAGVNMEVFRAFTEGFLKQTAATLTQAEIDTLGISCFALACAGLRTGDAVSG